MYFEDMGKELNTAFEKAVDLDDFKGMMDFTKVKATINRYKDKNRDKLIEEYELLVKIIGNHNYMYWEKEHLKWLLKGNKIEDFTF